MLKTLLRSKLHRINVTQVELDYEGSCAVDREILAKAKMQEYEKVDICLLYTSPSPRDRG